MYAFFLHSLAGLVCVCVCVCVCVLSCRLCVLLCLVALGAVAPVPLEALRGFVSRGGKAYFGKLADGSGRCSVAGRMR